MSFNILPINNVTTMDAAVNTTYAKEMPLQFISLLLCKQCISNSRQSSPLKCNLLEEKNKIRYLMKKYVFKLLLFFLLNYNYQRIAMKRAKGYN